MATETTLLTLSFLVEQDAATAREAAYPFGNDEQIRKAVLLAIGSLVSNGGRSDVRVDWSSLTSMPLDGATGYGRCAVCHCWTYDAELADGEPRGGVSRGAVVDGSLRCDIHLPSQHPLGFGNQSYDGPSPEAPADRCPPRG